MANPTHRRESGILFIANRFNICYCLFILPALEMGNACSKLWEWFRIGNHADAAEWESKKAAVVYIFREYICPAVLTVYAFITYAVEAYSIQKNKNGNSLSIVLVMIYIASNTLRILFWIGARFQLYLLIQSILMLCIQLIVMTLLIRYRNRSQPAGPIDQSPKAQIELRSPQDEVKWDNQKEDYALSPKADDEDSRLVDESSLMDKNLNSTRDKRDGSVPNNQLANLSEKYEILDLMLLFKWPNGWKRASSFWLVIYFFITSSIKVFMFLWYVLQNTVLLQLLGTFAMTIEGVAMLPQVYQNSLPDAEITMSKSMPFMGLVSGLIRLVFFFWSRAPYQFLLCCIIDITLHCILAYQVCCKRNRVDGSPVS